MRRAKGGQGWEFIQLTEPEQGTVRLDDGDRVQFERILAQRDIFTVFQPVVDLVSDAVVGYEALTRGPAGTSLSTPDRLFAIARRLGLNAEFDRLCRETAVRTAVAAGLTAPLTLFVNTEPDTGNGLGQIVDTAGLPIVLELTERELLARPADVLHTVATARGMGWAIALDDVGVNPESLAMLAIVNPEVIKLDLTVVQGRPHPQTTDLADAVHTQSDRSGAVILAEGIECAEHLDLAVNLGATLGQGYLFGRPQPLSFPLPRTASAIRLPQLSAPVSNPTPYEWSSAGVPVGGDKRLLHQLSRQLEAEAQRGGPATILLSTFQSSRDITVATARRYTELARHCALVGMIAVGVRPEPLPGVRGGQLPGGHPLSMEWHVVVITPKYSGALLARQVGPDLGQESAMEYVLVQDREIVCAAARSLLQYITASHA